ncbi:MAG: acyl-CoA synthetase [Methyloligellaceae bacterium]
MLPKGDTYEEIRETFSWNIPEFYNIGVDICDKWANKDPKRLALTFIDANNRVVNYNFSELKMLSNKLANCFTELGLKRGDRIGVLLPQAPETVFAHIASHKIGAISLPLFMLFGIDGLEYRLNDAGVKAIVTNGVGAEKLNQIRDKLPELEFILTMDGSHHGSLDLYLEMENQSRDFLPVNTKADDPAFIIYTSGTTGQPKGALHAHRVLLGHLPGVEMSHDLLPQPGDKIWTPADWAWIGGLLDVLMPALHHGVPVVAKRFDKFTAEAAFDLLEKHQIKNAFIPPTALKMMRTLKDPEKRWKLNMRTIASGGESLGPELLDWGRKTFGLTINEFYGQTECNMVISSCTKLMNGRPGWMGKAVPGHVVRIVDDNGETLPDGESGNVAIKNPNPVMFLKYWNNPEATRNKFAGEWLLTGDKGIRDSNNWLQFIGRDDDVITSAGYRIGPGEIEDNLMSHSAVKNAGVIGKPDKERTEIVKAYIVLREDMEQSDFLAKDIQNWVKTRLSAHEYPREIAFVEELPMTVTGKIIRGELRKWAKQELDEQEHNSL